ncbi:transposase [Streptomyces sp. NRRL S-813]|uniref:transposase n=1 Tax=Streptomyces sp. NRRL S-813 TaxID=1463919 RepID=UPI003B634FC6
MHLACDGRGRPLAPLLTAGQRHDGVCARPLLERLRVLRLDRGRPRCRPAHVVADRAYASRGFRAYLRKRGISHTIPEKRDQQRHRRNRGRDGGRPPAIRPGDLPSAQQRRTLLQPAQELPRHRHPIRQDRHLL